MKRLTYRQQLRFGMIVLIASFAASLIFKIPSLYKIGIMFYGFLFAMNPVAPPNVRLTRQTANVIRAIGAVVFIIGLTGKF